MTAFTAGAVLTASALNTAFNTQTINAQTGTTYTFGSADAGELVTLTNTSGGTATIPANATWGAATGTIIGVLNAGTAGSFTIGTAAGVTLNASSTSLAALESGTLIKTATNTWYFQKGGGLPKASVSSTSGSPSVDTTSRPGKTIYTFTGSGSLTLGTAGTCEVLCIAGGGAGGGSAGAANGGGGGGAGGRFYSTSAYFDSGTVTITVGAGGATSGNNSGLGGNSSRCGNYFAITGQGGQGNSGFYIPEGGSGGGGTSTTAGTGISGLGNNGGTGNSVSGGSGGGGGAGAVGANAVTTTGGAGGNGSADSITGSSVTRAGGGGGGNAGAGGGAGGTGGGGNAGSAGSANLGGGGGGKPGNSAGAGGTGGSGLVIVVIG